MKKKIVLLLQGGGALGAFQCGAWNAPEYIARLSEQGFQNASSALDDYPKSGDYPIPAGISLTF